MEKNLFNVFKHISLPRSGEITTPLDNGVILRGNNYLNNEEGTLTRIFFIVDPAIPDSTKRTVSLGTVTTQIPIENKEKNKEEKKELSVGRLGYTDNYVVLWTLDKNLDRIVNGIYDVRNHCSVPVNELSQTYLQILEEELSKENTNESGRSR